MLLIDRRTIYRARRLADQYPVLRHMLWPIVYPWQAFRRSWIPRRVVEQAQEQLFAEAPLVSVPEFDGVFRVGAQSHLFRRLLVNGYYEPALASLYRRFLDPSRDVVDVGANVGFYTVLAAKHIEKRVLAIEPTDYALSLLKENVESNSVSERVVVFEGVVSDAAGVVTLNFMRGREEYSSIGNIVHPAVRGVVKSEKEVRSETLDKLIGDYGLCPGLIKIDVEGAEQRVFAGATGILKEIRPVVMSEFSPQLLRRNGASPDAVLRSLRDCGYRLIDPAKPLTPLGRRDFGDLLAVPEELHSRYELFEIVDEAHRGLEV